MPIVMPDTSAAEDFSQPIPEGTYKAKIASCDVGKSKAGNQKIMPKLMISVDGKNRTRTAHLNITGEGAMGFDQILRACHLDEIADHYRDASIQPKRPFDTDVLKDQELMVVIGTQMYVPDGAPAGTAPVPRDQINGFLRA